VSRFSATSPRVELDSFLTGDQPLVWRAYLPVLLSMMMWGDKYYTGKTGRPRIARHVDCGGEVAQQLACTKCAQVLDKDDIEILPGPALATPDRSAREDLDG
jgi:hypothetical protein